MHLVITRVVKLIIYLLPLKSRFLNVSSTHEFLTFFFFTKKKSYCNQNIIYHILYNKYRVLKVIIFFWEKQRFFFLENLEKQRLSMYLNCH